MAWRGSSARIPMQARMPGQARKRIPAAVARGIAGQPENRNLAIKQRQQGRLAGAHGNTMKHDIGVKTLQRLTKNIALPDRCGAAGNQCPGAGIQRVSKCLRQFCGIIGHVAGQRDRQSPLGAPGGKPGSVDIGDFATSQRRAGGRTSPPVVNRANDAGMRTCKASTPAADSRAMWPA